MDCCSACGQQLNSDAAASSSAGLEADHPSPDTVVTDGDDFGSVALSGTTTCQACGARSQTAIRRKRSRGQVPFDTEWAPIQQGLDQFTRHASVGISTPYSTLLALYTRVYNLSTRHDDREAVRDIRALLYANMRTTIHDYHQQQQSLLLERERRLREERHRGVRVFLMWAVRAGIPDEVLGNLFHLPPSPGFLELVTMHDALAGFLPDAWARHTALHRPFCLVFRYLEMYYVRDYALLSVKGCLLSSFIDHLLAPYRHAVYVLLAYPGLLHPELRQAATSDLLLNGGPGEADCAANRLALAFVDMARSGPEFAPEFLAVLQTGYRRYHAAKEGGEGPAIPATGWLEEQSDDSMTAPPTAPTPDGTSVEADKVHSLPESFAADVERVVTAVMGADAVPRVLHRLAKHGR